MQSVTDKLSRWLLWQLSVSRVDEDWRSSSHQQVRCDVKALEGRNVGYFELGKAVVVHCNLYKSGAVGEVYLGELVARHIHVGEHGVALECYGSKFVTRHIHLCESLEAGKVECASQLFIFPLDFSHVVAYNCDSFPCGRVFEICYFQSFGIGPVFFGRLSQKILKLF